MDPAPSTQFNVGGLTLDRPFKIRRLGHFGINVDDIAENLRFYTEILGFSVSDPIDFGPRLAPEQRAAVGPAVGYFTRYGSDHHAFVLFPRRVREAMDTDGTMRRGVTVNQIT